MELPRIVINGTSRGHDHLTAPFVSDNNLKARTPKTISETMSIMRWLSSSLEHLVKEVGEEANAMSHPLKQLRHSLDIVEENVEKETQTRQSRPKRRKQKEF